MAVAFGAENGDLLAGGIVLANNAVTGVGDEVVAVTAFDDADRRVEQGGALGAVLLLNTVVAE